MFLQYLFMMLVTFLCGLTVGLLYKGIHININHKSQPEPPKEYNESLVPMLPQEVQQYYHSTNGQNKF